MIEKKKMSLPNIKDMEYEDEVSELSVAKTSPKRKAGGYQYH
jgi:hypothetical protein